MVLSSLERRFRFSSTAVSILLVSFDASVLISIIFISYFGEKRHKPRWLGYGLIIQGIGAFIFAFPQFLFGKYTVGAAGTLTLESCDEVKDFSSSCDSSNNWAYVILLLGNVLIGIGAAPLFTLGLSFIDDITLPKYVPIHMGLFYVSVAVGPAIGYGLGGGFLSIYVDPIENTALQETSPGWVGAWWLCFIFSSILSLIISVPFLMYPRFLSNYTEVVEARRKQHAVSYTSKYEEENSLTNQLKAFPAHMWDLCQSKSFIFVTLALSFLFLTLYGLVAFGPKFIESVFNIPASTASILAGAVGKSMHVYINMMCIMSYDWHVITRAVYQKLVIDHSSLSSWGAWDDSGVTYCLLAQVRYQEDFNYSVDNFTHGPACITRILHYLPFPAYCWNQHTSSQ